MDIHTMTAAERAEGLRAAMRAWTSGVTIVTAAYAGEQHGMTVSSFTSISLDPPLIIISLQRVSRTHELVSKAKAFGVTILAADQRNLSERFSGAPSASAASAASAAKEARGDRLEGLETETFVTGSPFIKGGLAFLDCHVTESIHSGMNTIFIAEVVAVRSDDHEHPLVYHDRQYRELQER